MIRFLLFALAIVTGVMGYVMEQPLLFYVAAGLVLVGIVFIVIHLQQQRKKARAARQMRPRPQPRSPQEELSALGITEVRPVSRSGRSPQPAAALPAEEPAPSKSEAAAPPPETPPAAPPRPTPQARAPVTVGEDESFLPEGFLKPFLETVRSATGAHTVGLLSQRGQEATFHLDTVVSASRHIRRHTRIPARSSFLHRVRPDQPVTALKVGVDSLPVSDLEYYSEAAAVTEVAIAPVPAMEPHTVYLLADSIAADGFGQREYRLLNKFAHLLHDIFADDAESLLRPVAPPPSEPTTPDDRPRREIIAEEMRKARATGYPLALALVYQNDAEVVAEEGSKAVDRAEKALFRKLSQAAPQARVERFGELTYGVFHYQPPEQVEAWAAHFQNGKAEVSIGVAMLAERHTDPDTFRADATAALSEAFRTKQCVLVE